MKKVSLHATLKITVLFKFLKKDQYERSYRGGYGPHFPKNAGFMSATILGGGSGFARRGLPPPDTRLP